MNKLLEKNYKKPDKLYNIDKNTAYWPEDAEDYIYWGSEADKWAEDYAKSYKVKMSPKDYLDLTTVKGADNIKLGDDIDGNPTRELDIDEFNKETYQNIFLQVAFRDSSDNTIARVVGHEGRHRMFALMQAGVKSVDVELRCDVSDTNYDRNNPFPLNRIVLIGQFNPRKVVIINNPISMSWKKHKEIRPDLVESIENPNLDRYEIYEMLKREIEGLSHVDAVNHLGDIFPEMVRIDLVYLYTCLTAPQNLEDTEKMREWFEQIAEDNSIYKYEPESYLTIDYNKINPTILNDIIGGEALVETLSTDYLNPSKTVYDGIIMPNGDIAATTDPDEEEFFSYYDENKDIYFTDDHPLILICPNPTDNQFDTLLHVIEKHLNNSDYCKIRISYESDLRIFENYEGACNDDTGENTNEPGYKVIPLPKSKKTWTAQDVLHNITDIYKDELIESLLLEKTRQELIDKSKKSDNYAKNNQGKGKNRWERRLHSSVANTVRDYNQIDMDAFFKADILDFVIKVKGETDNYSVQITFEEALKQIQDEIKRNKGKLEFKCILRALITAFNKGDVYVSCSCPDWYFRQSYWSTQGKYNSGTPQPDNGKAIANPNDSKGGGCKHVNLVLGNLDWLMKVASVINNYIYWAKDNIELQYSRYIFPQLYGMPYDKAIQLTLDMFDEKGNLRPEFATDTLKSDENIINMANMMGRVRGRYKKKPEQSINPRYSDIHPKKEEPEEETNALGLDLGEEEPEFDMNSEEETK